MSQSETIATVTLTAIHNYWSMRKISSTELRTCQKMINKQRLSFRGEPYKEIIMEATVKQANKITDMKARMSDIYLAVSWREIARTYFDKSVPWFQHKMYGIDGNGGKGGFTEDEAGQLKGALLDLSNRIRRAAENIPAPATV